jgi:hypothetical protein
MKTKGEMMIFAKHRRKVTHPDFWALVNLFRQEQGRGWVGYRIDFHHSKIVTGGGRKWDMEAYLGIDLAGRIEARVFLLDRAAARPACPARRVPRLSPAQFEFMKAVERRMRRLGYEGSFRPDPIGSGFSTYFHKPLDCMAEVERERELLERLDLGAAPNPGLTKKTKRRKS